VDDLDSIAIVNNKMACGRKSPACLLVHETKLPPTVQRNFRHGCGRHAADVKASQIGVQSLKRLAMLVTVKELVGLVWVRRLLKLCWGFSTPSMEIISSCLTWTWHTSEHKQLRLCAYKVQLIQAMEPDDHPRWAAFATEMLQRIDEDNDYITSIWFSDEANFHTSGKVNRHNVRIWELENPRVVSQNKRDNPKVDVWCALMYNKVIGPFFFLSASFQ
jgi:hypothetical protein